jgi:hypothetical protein
MGNASFVSNEEAQALERLNRAFAAVRVGTQTATNRTVTPSQLDMEWCDRKVFFKMSGEAQIPRDTLRGLLHKAVGNTIHEIVQSWVKTEVPGSLVEFVTPDTNIGGLVAHGRIDLILAGASKTTDYLAEIKSCSSEKFVKYLKAVPLRYYTQILMNAYLMDLWRPGLLILVNRDTLAVVGKWVPVTREAWEEESARVTGFIAKHVVPGIPPEIPAFKGEHLCSSDCGYYWKCFGGRAAGKVSRSSVFGPGGAA